MYDIRLDGLNKEKANRWIDKAKENLATDKVYAFISSWIVFNYYYGTYATQYENEFKVWCEQHANGHTGDRSEWRYLISEPKFNLIYTKFIKENLSDSISTFDLPVKTYRKNPPAVPTARTGQFKVNDLSIDELFSVIYQIRNNLIHGQKDPDKDIRDNELGGVAADFLVPFCGFLINKTGP